MSKEFELEPCPFCGAAAKLEQEADHHGEFYNLGCSNEKCMAHHMVYTETPEEMPVKKAVATWNTRPDFTAGRALGRREMKGKVEAAICAHACTHCDFLVHAIEAIPEEV